MTANDQEIIAVVGVANNGVIGRSGDIPWKSSVDLRHFKALTMGHPIVMGRKTFESIGRPLPGRINVILSRDQSLEIPGAVVLHSKRAVLTRLAKHPKIMIIGGDQIYREFYHKLTKIELTHLKLEADGDAFFHLDPSRDWRIADSRAEFDEKLGASLEFKTYLPDDTKNPYLNAGVKELLRMFGAGKPVPGSGAAAALQALLSAYLIMTVGNKTTTKRASANVRKTIAQYAFRISSILVPRLRSLFLQDIEVFDEVVQLRIAAASASGAAKGRVTRKLTRQTHTATAIPDEVYDIAAELLEMAEYLFANGWRGIRGDSGAAISSAMSAMLSCTFVMSLNDRSLRRGGAAATWADKVSRRSQDSLRALSRLPGYLAADQLADTGQAAFEF